MLRIDSPPPLTYKSNFENKREIELQEKSNRMSLMIMKKSIIEAFLGTNFENINIAKEFLVKFGKRFVKNEKSKICTLLKT